MRGSLGDAIHQYSEHNQTCTKVHNIMVRWERLDLFIRIAMVNGSIQYSNKVDVNTGGTRKGLCAIGTSSIARLDI